jgi:soluble lytic murein transglycosylase-like protein
MENNNQNLEESLRGKMAQVATAAAMATMPINQDAPTPDLDSLYRNHPFQVKTSDRILHLAKVAMGLKKVDKKLSKDNAIKYATLAVKHEHPEFPKAEDLMALMAVESTFNEKAISGKGAYGITQVIPKWHHTTANALLASPDHAIERGASALRDNYRIFKGDKNAAIQAYNVGPSDYKIKGKRVPEYLQNNIEFAKKFSAKPENE